MLAWLEQPGVRLMEIDGDWSMPLRVGLTDDVLPQLTGLANQLPERLAG